MVGETIALITD